MATEGWAMRFVQSALAIFLAGKPYGPTLSARNVLLLRLVALAAVIGIGTFYVSRNPWTPDQDARRASQLMYDGLEELGRMRHEIGEPIDPALDPAGSGLIGIDYSDITTSLGDLRAKQTSLNPSFAGLIVKWLKEAGVKPGDRIAVTFSGSFPALNLAVLSACEVMGLKPLTISSVGASMYGANIFGFTWLDMEKRLNDVGLLHVRSRYASLGGIMDTNGGVFETGIAEGEAAIARNGVEYLHEGTPRTVEHDAQQRMSIYFADGKPAAFVNVGGNVTAIGWINETHLLGEGLLHWFPSSSSPQRGTLFRMHESAVPVIHLLNIERLAAANLLRVAPATLSPEADFSALRNQQVKWLVTLLIAWFALGAIFTKARPAKA